MFGEPQPWYKRHKTALIRTAGGVIGVLLLVQLFYPYDRLPLFATVDGVNVSGWKKQDAAWQLDTLSQEQPVNIKLAGSDETYDKTTVADVGIKSSNRERIDQSGYPVLLRFVPTSLFWYGPAQADQAPSYQRDTKKQAEYLNETLGGESCNLPAKNATLKYENDSLSIVGAKNGGTCKESDAVTALASLSPRLNAQANIVIPVEVKEPKIEDPAARELKDKILEASKAGVNMKVADNRRTIPQTDVLGWLDFDAKESTLTYAIDEKRANHYFVKNITPGVTKPAGTTKISTRDFTVTSQKKGATGRTLAVGKTASSVREVLDGKEKVATAFTTPVAPKVSYSRTYTKTSTGIAALLKFYDDDNPGVFGVSFQELGGQGRSAAHNVSRQFTTASTYKLYVAYGTLRKVDAGKWKWSDSNIANGRNLSTCFDDMIVKSDNACAESLLKKLGYSTLTKDIQKIGMTSSGFVTGDSPNTTAGDLTLFLTKLERKQLPIKSASRDRLLGAMKRNVYRQGIPAGASGTVADKVGFLNGLLHDAAIVNSPKGTYVLTVMTDGSSWGAIADLTRKIEALR